MNKSSVTKLYKRFRLNQKSSKPGDLMAKAKKYKSFPKERKHKSNFGLMQFGDRSATQGGAQGNGNSTVMGTNPRFFKKGSKAKKHKSMKKDLSFGGASQGNNLMPRNMRGSLNPNSMSNSNSTQQAGGVMFKKMCKSCGKKHAMGKHMKKRKK